MEIVLLCLSAILIARCIEKRSTVVSVAHAIFFTVILTMSFFTTDIPLIRQAMENLMGTECYETLRLAMCTPCQALYSTHLVIFIAEIVSLVIAAVYTVMRVTEKVTVSHKRSPEHPRQRKTPVYARFFSAYRHIFLQYCRLLD